MKKTITIRDVAREAGVSHQTVSRAFNDKGEISPETKQHVLTVAREMGYRPSGLARSLSTNRTHTVGFIIPDITSVFFSLIAKGAESVSAQKGYSFFLVNTYRDILHQTKALETLWDNRADGIILYASFPPEQELREYVELFQHIVYINSQSVPMIAGKTAAINVDDYAGANLAVSHLLAGGHSKIAYLT
ncbi:MAG: LacI family DNA-binding transcriptional regulator, partial [Anaerolineae bacterium]|nr:LacI family DNA-binding transcriptional regulator [Anaerolineae bacterium]